MQRQFKSADAERVELQDRLNELQSLKESLQTGKRKAEQQLSSLQEEFEEMEGENRDNAEKLRKAMEQVCNIHTNYSFLLLNPYNNYIVHICQRIVETHQLYFFAFFCSKDAFPFICCIDIHSHNCDCLCLNYCSCIFSYSTCMHILNVYY